MCASFADVNNDGLPDLVVTFWYPENKLYINETVKGHIRFRDATATTDIAFAPPAKSNAVAFADVNNDGFQDLFIANRNAPNKLYLNNGKGGFINRTSEYFPCENYLSNGAVFADFDLDGFVDLYLTNVGENVLYKNIGGKCFKIVTAQFGAELSGYCTGCAAGDVDNDGDQDLYVANYIEGNSMLFLNISEKKNFLKLKLHGVISNKDAIGAKIWLYKRSGPAKSLILSGFNEINGGSGYGSVSAKESIFGLLPHESSVVKVKFPSSPDTLVFCDLQPGTSLDIYELTGIKAFLMTLKLDTLRFFINQENQPEILKYSLIMLIMVWYNLRTRRNSRNIIIFRSISTIIIFIIFLIINHYFIFQWPALPFFNGPVVFLGLLAILHLFVDRILIKRLAQSEKVELREKLSRDLHDDLASTLGSISIYAETLKGMTEREQITEDFKILPGKITRLTQNALQSISDIIWMTSPRNDSLQSLISKTNNYIFEILNDNQIGFHSEMDIPDEAMILNEKLRNNIFLILKEAIHNIIRHSKARNVEFSAKYHDHFCSIILKDDGIGISGSEQNKKSLHGNGLLNMQRRGMESQLSLVIKTPADGGTEIMITFTI